MAYGGREGRGHQRAPGKGVGTGSYFSGGRTRREGELWVVGEGEVDEGRD